MIAVLEVRSGTRSHPDRMPDGLLLEVVREPPEAGLAGPVGLPGRRRTEHALDVFAMAPPCETSSTWSPSSNGRTVPGGRELRG